MLQLNTAAAAVHTITKHILASDMEETCVLVMSMFDFPLVECASQKCFKDRLTAVWLRIHVCWDVMMYCWLGGLTVCLNYPSPEYFHQAPHFFAPQSGLHSPSVHIIDNSTAVFSHHHKVQLYASTAAHQRHPHL